MNGWRFPVLDADRTHEHEEIGRVVIDGADALEPYVPMTDSNVSIPLRVAVNQAAGVVLEIGPYTLDLRDVRRLQDAIERFYLAGGGA
ncbi:hypothetical protein [Gordonia alkanivorans]|uniref:Uncharacterized protein n=2 Tax=root TaxID=1 RepID=A0A159B6D7_9CAUD|nr:hypothetical protein [Gordonia alkanivorans]YP_009324432.1 hypothetical protein BOX05_gp40 [Gordonia phage GAL1]AKJ72055.1 hypothetical protein GAL1_40 [Gordonia phage GAL1]GAA13883.1 hypothetical protein GOALK_093_00710 [Gordonia alkanivorans NBRC 16433]